MSSTNFKSIANLVEHIQSEITKLQSGNLSIDELSELLESTRELHERAVVLNYLAIERKVKGEEDKKEGFKLNFGISKKTPEVHPNQTNLLDAIAEQNEEVFNDVDAIKYQPVVENFVSEKEEEMVDAIENSIVEEPVHTPVEPELNAVVEAEEEVETTVEENVEEKAAVSINEKFAREKEELTLAEKLSQKPIEDLRKAIGLNQKFLFMNDLFEGENLAFNDAVDKLNNFAVYLEAEDYMNNVLAPKYNWNSSNESVQNFTDLVKRRFK